MRRASLVVAGCLLASAAWLGCGPEPPGKAEFEMQCGVCHPTRNVLARRNDRAGWVRTVHAMRARGATLSDEEAARVIDYLTAVRPLK